MLQHAEVSVKERDFFWPMMMGGGNPLEVG